MGELIAAIGAGLTLADTLVKVFNKPKTKAVRDPALMGASKTKSNLMYTPVKSSRMKSKSQGKSKTQGKRKTSQSKKMKSTGPVSPNQVSKIYGKTLTGKKLTTKDKKILKKL